jgi:oligopeptide transport system ATP-binding protein
MDDLLLRVTDVYKNFPIDAARTVNARSGVSVDIRRGEIVGLVGESGCGKTTLGRTIVKLYRPDGGTVAYQGQDIWRQNKAEHRNYSKNVQMIYQDPYASLDPLSVAGTIIAEGLDIHGMYPGKAARRARVLELLDRVGLNPEHISRFPHEFSGGQRQRIGVARALAVEPQLIVCDEPISALDVSIQAQVVNLLMDLQQHMGLSYLFITHDLSMVRHISDRIVVMYLGRIVESAPSGLLYRHSCHPYTRALLSAIPLPDPAAERARHRTLLTGDPPNPINLGDCCAFSGRCPHAKPICRENRPALTEIEAGHAVACHFSREL